MAASSSDCSMTTRSASPPGRPAPAAPAAPAGPRSWIWSRQRRSSVRDWHQSSTVPTSVTRAARPTGTRSAFALRPTRIRPCSGGSSRIESGSAATRSPGRSSGRTELLASGNATGWPISRSKSWLVDRDLVPLLRVARDDAEPGPVGRRRPRSRRRTTGPCRRRSGCRRRAGRRRNRPRRRPRPGRARRWSAPAGAYGGPGSSANHDGTTSTIRSRTTSGVERAAVEQDRVGPRGPVVGR